MTIMWQLTWPVVWEKEKMLLTLRNVQIIIRTYSIHRRIFMRPRKADGIWKSPFNPSDVGHAKVQA